MNMLLYLSLLMAKYSVDFHVTAAWGYYTQDYFCSKDARAIRDVKKYYGIRSVWKLNYNRKDPYSPQSNHLSVPNPQLQGEKSVHTYCSQCHQGHSTEKCTCCIEK